MNILYPNISRLIATSVKWIGALFLKWKAKGKNTLYNVPKSRGTDSVSAHRMLGHGTDKLKNDDWKY